MSGGKPFYKTKPFLFSVGILVSVVCMWLAVRPLLQNGNAWAQFVDAFKQADYRSVPFFWISLFIFYWLKAWRWRLMLAPVGNYAPMKELLPPIMIGFSFNNLLPFRMGEVARCFVFSRQKKLPFPTVVSSVVLERLLDLIAVLFYLGIGLCFLQGVDPTVKKTAIVFAAITTVAVLGGLAFVIWTKPVLDLIEFCLKRVPLLPHAVTDKICHLLESSADGLAAMKNWRLILAMFVISMIKWAFNGILVTLSLWSFGLPASLPVSFVVLGVVAIFVSVPAAPGFFGVIQFCFMLVLGLIVKGDNAEAAILAASIYFHMMQYIPVTLIGVLYFIRTGLKLQDVEAQREHAEEPEDNGGAVLTNAPA